MAVMINPRGTSGSGKSWLVRTTIAVYLREGAEAVPLPGAGRSRPIGWQLLPTAGQHPLAVVGHYEATRGGTDTIPATTAAWKRRFEWRMHSSNAGATSCSKA